MARSVQRLCAKAPQSLALVCHLPSRRRCLFRALPAEDAEVSTKAKFSKSQKGSWVDWSNVSVKSSAEEQMVPSRWLSVLSQEIRGGSGRTGKMALAA